MKISLGISNFLKRSLVFLILLFSCISLHWSLRKTFLFVLAILWNSAFNGYIFSFAFHFSLFHSCLYGLLRQPFGFLHFFFLGMILITASCTTSWNSVHSSSDTLSIRSNPLNHSVHGVLKARILKGFAISFSIGPCFVTLFKEVLHIILKILKNCFKLSCFVNNFLFSTFSFLRNYLTSGPPWLIYFLFLFYFLFVSPPSPHGSISFTLVSNSSFLLPGF